MSTEHEQRTLAATMRPSGNHELVSAMSVEIKTRRLELGFSQEDLAGRCELDRPYISLIEVGKKQPSLSVLYRIAIALDLTFAEFADRIELRYKRDQSVRQATVG